MGCAHARPAQPASSARPTRAREDEAVLLERDRAFDQAAAERGIDGFMDFIADDVAILPPGEPLLRGRDAIRAHWAEALAERGALRWRPVEAHLSGELGYTLGTYEIHRVVDGKKVDRYGKYLTLWRKDRDGVWRVVSDVGSPSPAPKPAAEPAPARASGSELHSQ